MSIGIQCPSCKNFFKRKKKFKCRAFKNGIPIKIVTGQFDHTKPFKNDNGIRYDPIKEYKDLHKKNTKKRSDNE